MQRRRTRGSQSRKNKKQDKFKFVEGSDEDLDVCVGSDHESELQRSFKESPLKKTQKRTRHPKTGSRRLKRRGETHSQRPQRQRAKNKVKSRNSASQPRTQPRRLQEDDSDVQSAEDDSRLAPESQNQSEVYEEEIEVHNHQDLQNHQKESNMHDDSQTIEVESDRDSKYTQEEAKYAPHATRSQPTSEAEEQGSDVSSVQRGDENSKRVRFNNKDDTLTYERYLGEKHDESVVDEDYSRERDFLNEVANQELEPNIDSQGSSPRGQRSEEDYAEDDRESVREEGSEVFEERNAQNLRQNDQDDESSEPESIPNPTRERYFGEDDDDSQQVVDHDDYNQNEEMREQPQEMGQDLDESYNHRPRRSQRKKRHKRGSSRDYQQDEEEEGERSFQLKREPIRHQNQQKDFSRNDSSPRHAQGDQSASQHRSLRPSQNTRIEEEEDPEYRDPNPPMGARIQDILSEAPAEFRQSSHMLGNQAKKYSTEALETQADQLIQQIHHAIESDREDARNKRLALNKIKLVDPLIKQLKNYLLSNQFLAKGGLSALADFINQLADGSWPLGFRRLQILKLIDQMPITFNQLESSNIGVILDNMRISKKIPEKQKRLIRKMKSKWARVICALPTDYGYLESCEQDVKMPLYKKKKEYLEGKVLGKREMIPTGEGSGWAASKRLKSVICKPLKMGSNYIVRPPNKDELIDDLKIECNNAASFRRFMVGLKRRKGKLLK